MARKPQFRLEGIEEVVRNMNKEVKKIKDRSFEGMIDAIIHLRRDMEQTSPLIPIDEGNLRASWFVVTMKGKGVGQGGGSFKGDNASKVRSNHSSVIAKYKAEASTHREPFMIFGFSANYASIVHERVDVTFKRPGAGAKFFEAALKRNQAVMLSLIANKAKI
jgi:hypothetical protein